MAPAKTNAAGTRLAARAKPVLESLPVPPIASRMSAVRLALLLSGLSLAAGCASQSAPVPDAPLAPDAAAQLQRGNWTADNLHDLLVAEVAGQRDRFDIALAAYLRQARALQDATLAERATRIALYAGDPDALHEAATLWSALAPDSNEASAAAIFSLLQRDEVEQVEPLLDGLLKRGVAVRFDYLVQYARQADEPSRHRVAQLLEGLAGTHARNASLWLARADLALLENDAAQALAHVEHSLDLEPRQPAAIDLHGRLLMDAGRLSAARRTLARGARWFPQERALRLSYLRALLEEGSGGTARRELQSMLDVWPGDADLQLSLALLEWETGHTARAQDLFRTMIEAGQREDDAWMYLGRIAMEAGDDEEAATNFQNVRGARFLGAQVQVAMAWARLGRIDEARALLGNLRGRLPDEAPALWLAESELLLDAGRDEDALALLDTALGAAPGDTGLLYARAMVAGELGHTDILERDLGVILAADPDNASALNALGYTLADRGERLDEAHAMIERALTLRPDDPAILDSMGWVLFRLGRPAEALPWLRRALELADDGEIAAHLGEVLWNLGERSEARRVWRRAQEQTPDNKHLQRTLERHGL